MISVVATQRESLPSVELLCPFLKTKLQMTLLLNFFWFKTFKSKLHAVIHILKLINDSVVWISYLNWHRFLRFYFSVFPYLVLVPTEKITHILKTVFDHIFKHLDLRQKYFAARRIFNSLRSFVFDMYYLNCSGTS